jgi:IclR family transcriptional regulator, KDG regulon repressor
VLDHIAAETKETVSWVVRDGMSAVYLAARKSPFPTRLFARVGRRRSLHVGAGGKVLLAFAPREIQHAVLSSPLTAFTPPTVTDPVRLAEILDEIRRIGISERFGDLDNHSFGFGTPIRDGSGVIGALRIAGPTSRLTAERRKVYRDLVRMEAKRISLELGAPPAS